ncbi:MAG: hypothetical protein ABI837_09835 [Acidobacteriota bacterium]
MKEHYSEADLLETYYTQPGESMPVMMHLAACTDCAARYERLDRKLREAASCNTEKPDTFWTRQRMQVMKRIGDHQSRLSHALRVTRIAAAAAFAFLLGGAVMYKAVEPALQTSVLQSNAPVAQAKVAAPRPTAGTDAPVLAHDAWQSDELKDFHSVVEWETWVDSSGSNGGQL